MGFAYTRAKLKIYPRVTFETTTLEDWQLQEDSFDLVTSAQAFHWVNRETEAILSPTISTSES